MRYVIYLVTILSCRYEESDMYRKRPPCSLRKLGGNVSFRHDLEIVFFLGTKGEKLSRRYFSDDKFRR